MTNIKFCALSRQCYDQHNSPVAVGLCYKLGILSYIAQLGKKDLYCVNRITTSYTSNPVSTTKFFSGSFIISRERERVNLV
jgi:hypothetical protein